MNSNARLLKAKRLQQLFDLARQRYVDAGGNLHKTPSGRKGEDFMTDVERQESWEIIDEIFSLRN